MATSIESHVVDITTCGICLEKFNIPKYLPCLHTFCERCIQTYISSKFEKRHTQSIHCPVCRTNVTSPNENYSSEEWAKALPLNFLIAGLLQREKVESPQKQCMVCERMENKSDAIFICFDCSDLLCDNCCKHHKANKYTADHEINPIEQLTSDIHLLKSFRNKCSEHKGKDLELYCVDHEIPCCSMCVSIYHRKCEKVLSIEDAARDYNGAEKVKDLRTQLEKVEDDIKDLIKDRQSAMDKLESQYRGQKKKLDNVFSELVSKINDLKVRRETELLKIYDEAKENIDMIKLIFTNKKKNIENEKQILDACTSKASDVQVMVEVKRLKRHLEEHKKIIQSKADEIVDYKLSFQNENISDLLVRTESSCKISMDKTKTVTRTGSTKLSEIYSCNRLMLNASCWDVNGDNDAICFRVSKEIELCGILSFVCKDGASTCNLTAFVKDDSDQDLVVVSDTIDSKLAENKHVKVHFLKPVKLLANKKYHAIVVMTGPQCYSGRNGTTEVDSNGVRFTFEKSQFDNNGTSTTGGQIPGFLFRILL
ncbi:E3 ubiquitin-protein ligase TRIM56-like [Mytilus californianus]|uniref:E3 ubiquitin-protein ligase TRIM56-like n=1 Tax=Mytilus californianus TaxID=6549 RepID=UPI0022470B84|nr:E3 ubiquitin-protein ligase TRIM56-like [Mytilus californianus]